MSRMGGLSQVAKPGVLACLRSVGLEFRGKWAAENRYSLGAPDRGRHGQPSHKDTHIFMML